MKPISREGSERIIRFAFEYAREHGRKRVSCVTKANIMKFTDGLFLDVFRDVAKEYPEIEPWENLVDAVCMGLVQRPEEFDVLVLPNLYGDIVSDLTAGLVGGLGVAPGGNIGPDSAVFEATHGSAPKYKGQNKVNPTAMILSGMLMLDHLGERDAAQRLEAGRRRGDRARANGVTYDMKPSRDDPTAVGTSEYADAIIEKLEAERAVSDRRKVTVVGAGNVGATCAQVLAQRDYADIVLVDIKEGLPQGKALDINQMGAVLGYEPNVTGSNDYDATAGSDVVVITAGPPPLAGHEPRRPRDDEREDRQGRDREGRREEPGRDPDRRLEPARRDVPRREERLRASRRSASSARPASSTPRGCRRSSPGRPARRSRTCSAVVLGGHGDQMVSVISATTVGGVPIRKLVSEEQDPGDGRSAPPRAAASSCS